MRQLLVLGAVLCALACGTTDTATPGGASGGTTDGGVPDAGGSNSGGAATARLTLHVGGGGDVRSSNPAFECHADCTQVLGQGTRVTLVAVPDAGSGFMGWSGACSGTADCTVTLDANRDVTATFAPLPPPPPGTARVSVQFTGSGPGRVTSNTGGLDCPGTCSVTVASGTPMTLTATVDANSTFVGWGGACGGSGVCNLSANGDQTVWANFQANGPPPPPPPPPPPDECAGLVPPSVPPPQVFSVPPDGYANACAPGTTDGSGTMMLPTLTNVPPPGTFIYRFVGLDGHVKGSFTDRFDDIYIFGLFEQANGFVVARYNNFVASPQEQAASVFTVSPTGVKGPPQYIGSFFITAAVNPVGGAVTAQILTFSGSDVVSWDEAVHRRWTVHTAMDVVSVGVDRKGATLVIAREKLNSSNLRAFWIDPSGAAGADFPVSWTGGSLVPRVGDGFFVYDHVPPLVTSVIPTRPMGTPLAQIDAYATEAKPVPAWLAARPHKELHVVHGGTGYALIDSAGDVAPCSQQIEVVAPSGKSCGTASFFIAGSACSTGRLTVGYDGTAIQQLPAAMESVPDPAQSGHTCTWRYWPGFFR